MATDTSLAELLLRYEELRQAGEAPSAEELCRDCPQLLEEVKRRIAAIQQADTGAGPGERETQTTPQALAGTLKPGALREAPPDMKATTPELAAAADLDIRPGSEPVPGYRLVGRLGRGNFGEVWKAIAPGGFPVALKLMPLGERIKATELNALEIIKTVRHPNLISAFGAWQLQGFLIVAMELADRTLWDRFQEARDQGLPGIPAAELLEYLRQAAKGIDYLNEPQHSFAGKPRVSIQHRDIKPKNILLVGSGVKVADFGLVRLLDRAITGHTGNMTPAYAAPEFMRGQTSNQSDQYCLAATYCELRGGRLPFEGTLAQMLSGHLANAPDLSMLPESERPVLRRALAKEPGDRWPSCQAFVEALAQSMQPGAVLRRKARVSRWLAAAVVPALVGLLIVFAPSLLETPSEPNRPVQKNLPNQVVSANSKSAQKQSEAGQEPAGKHSKPDTRTPVVLQDDASRTQPPEEARVIANRQDDAAAAKEQVVAERKPSAPDAQAADFTEVAKAAEENLSRRTAKSDQRPAPSEGPSAPTKQDRVGELCRFKEHRGEVLAVAASPVSGHAISAGKDGMVWLWNVETGQPIDRLTGHTGAVHCVAFSRDGRLAISGGDDHTVRLWDIETRSPHATLTGHTEAVFGVALASDGLRAISGGQDTTVRVWNVTERLELSRFELPPAESVWSVALSYDDRHVLTASDSNIVRLWEIGSDKEAYRFADHRDVVWCVDFSADGARALSGGGLSNGQGDFAIRLWDVEKRKLVRELKGHAGDVRSVAFSADGHRAISGSNDTKVRLWDVDSGDELHCFDGHEETVHCVAITRDGRRALSASRDGTVRVWGLPP